MQTLREHPKIRDQERPEHCSGWRVRRDKLYVCRIAEVRGLVSIHIGPRHDTLGCKLELADWRAGYGKTVAGLFNDSIARYKRIDNISPNDHSCEMIEFSYWME